MIKLLDDLGIYFVQFYLTICVLFLAGKDADSHLLKDKTDNQLSANRVKRWHADGFALFILFVVPFLFWMPSLFWKIIIAAILIRGTFFDLAFNHWASLPESFLGGTAWSDRIFVRIFGLNGAISKSIAFFVVLIILNLLNVIL